MQCNTYLFELLVIMTNLNNVQLFQQAPYSFRALVPNIFLYLVPGCKFSRHFSIGVMGDKPTATQREGKAIPSTSNVQCSFT